MNPSISAQPQVDSLLLTADTELVELEHMLDDDCTCELRHRDPQNCSIEVTHIRITCRGRYFGCKYAETGYATDPYFICGSCGNRTVDCWKIIPI